MADLTKVVEEFSVAIKANGLLLKSAPHMDGKWHRTMVDGDKEGQLSGSYRGFLDGLPNGQIMNYRTGDKAVKWVSQGRQLDPAELAQLRADAQVRSAEREKDLQEQYAKTAKVAYGIYTNAPPAPDDHPYLQRKQVRAGDLRLDRDGNLLVPMRDEKGFLWNIQTIQPDGTKRYMRDGRKTGLMHMIDGTKPGPTIIAEGYATADTLGDATGYRVVVAFDAGNLKPVAEAVRKKWPKADLVIAADNDHKLESQNKPNTGKVRAKEAAQSVAGRWIEPDFSEVQLDRGQSDFNDMRQDLGKQAFAEVMKEQFRENPKAHLLGQVQPQKVNRTRSRSGLEMGM